MNKVSIDLVIEDPRWEKEIKALDLNLEKIAEKTLKFAGEKFDKETNIAFFLTNDEEIKEVNKEYRGKDSATNVLSFPQVFDPEIDDELPVLYLGDIFLSLDTLKSEIKNTNKSFKDHLLHLTIHGILHLLGYDHEEELDAEKMEKVEIETLASFNVKSPYEI